MARIRVALRHLKKTGTESGQAVRTVGGLSIDLEKRLVYLDGAEIHVTPLEYNLLTLFLKCGKSFDVAVYHQRNLWNQLWNRYAGAESVDGGASEKN